jgi:hypothetical protein
MAVQLDGKATERQRKYLGVLSSQGKEKLGKDFSIRKIASQRGIGWDEMSLEQANRLIKEVKALIEEKEATEADFQVTEQDLINKLAKEKKEEQRKATPSTPSEQKQANTSTPPYVLQVYPKEQDLSFVQEFFKKMDIDFVVLQEVRG